MKSIITGYIKNFLKKNGRQIKGYPDSDLIRRMKMVENYNIDTVFDIGANTGQYATIMREIGYKKRILSFEPLKSAFQELEKISANDNDWFVYNYALGNEDIKSMINVAGNSQSSSFLEMLPAHINSAPDSVYVTKEEIEIKKIDSIFSSFYKKGNNVLMKIDTQGFEKNVLDGANESLNYIKVIQLEMSVLPWYENEMLYLDMINFLGSKGYQLFSLENGFADPNTGQLLQVDGIFVK